MIWNGYKVALIGTYVCLSLCLILFACLSFSPHYSDDTKAILVSCFGGSIIGTLTFGMLAWLEKQNLK